MAIECYDFAHEKSLGSIAAGGWGRRWIGLRTDSGRGGFCVAPQPPLRWDGSMKRRLSCCVLVVLYAASTAFGQAAGEPVPGVGLHCWLGAEGAPFFARTIRCITDRELRLEEIPDMATPAIIDILHRELHFGSAASAERAFKANIERVRESAEVWNIRIFSEPYDSSWEEQRPQQLVSAVLCPRNTSCTVMFTR